VATTLPIFTFHTLADDPDVIACAPAVFRQGMAKLHALGYQTLDLIDAVAYLRRRERFPERAFVLTFDDGYQTVYTEAFQILQRYGMTATVFLTVGPRRGRHPGGRLPSMMGQSMLSWREIRDMHAAGVTVGAHTCTHPDLTRLSSDQILTEVCDSKAIIEEALGTGVTSFAYPFGRYERRSYSIVQQHFLCACSVKLGFCRRASDTYALERIDTYYLRSDRRFNLVGTRALPWYIHMRRMPRHFRYCLEQWLGL
jgi:peptidoglycan/xylan/chitin deacetylase (PgdA/CDA1 family)